MLTVPIVLQITFAACLLAWCVDEAVRHVRQAVYSLAPGQRGPAYTGILQAASTIMKTEGSLAFWKGNAANVVRVFPYAAAQLAVNDLLKRQLMAPVRSRCSANTAAPADILSCDKL